MTTIRTPFTGLHQNEIFAVDSTSAQVVVRPDNPDTPVGQLRVGRRVVEIAFTSGVGVVSVDNLEPDTSFTLEVLDGSGSVTDVLHGHTRPSIDTLSKVATISDVHLGADGFGRPRLLSEIHEEPYPLRCGRAAIDEAIDWGADALVIKGDLTDTGSREEWQMAEALLRDIDIPVVITAGNHDVWGTREVMPDVGAASIGQSVEDITFIDLPGVRVVLADTSKPGQGTGELARHRDQLVEIADISTPVLLFIHHHIQRTPLPWFWPPGITPENAMSVVGALSNVNSSILISSGHTHRNRRHHLLDGAVTFTEVSSTSDYPGVWAGYDVGARRIGQTVRRIAAPNALEWTERTRRALGGVWPRWSQGRLDDRCLEINVS